MFRDFCSRWKVWCYVFLVLPFTRICGETAFGSKDDIAGIVEGDLMLGGLFRIRKINGTNKCSQDLEDQVGIQRVEAMLYAIHEINRDKNLLPNVKLGAEIRDTCGLKTKALDESLKFILDSWTLRSRPQQNEQCLKNTTDVVGVVGASRSTLSIEVAKLLRLFKVPQVSYASTSTELSNENKYSYFARTVPSDSLQALAMLHVVKEFKWSSVFTINSAGSYGENGIKAFKKRLKSENSSVCVVLSEQVADESTIADYEKIISRFKEFRSTRVVVLFLKDHHLKMFLKTAKSQNYKNNVWVASDEWGTRTDVVKDVDQSDAITITLPSLHLTKFEKYFRNLSGSTPRSENPWFQRYWKRCGNSTCNTTFNDKVPYVIDAVYAFAHALHEMLKQKCFQMKESCNLRPVNGTELRNRILKINFTGASSSHVSFKNNGDSNGKYIIFHYTKLGHYQKLGEWQKMLNLTHVPSRLRKIISTCNDTCNAWARKLVKKETACCYKCLDCPDKESQYVENEVQCIDCGDFQRVNSNYTGCVDLPLRHISNKWFITIAFFACLGALCTSIVTALLLYNINSPLVKASERDLIFLLLLGVFLNYITAIIFVSNANNVICAIQRFGSGFSDTLCYATLLVKTDRIGRIFTTRNTKSVHFPKPHTQLVVVFLLIAIEVSLATAGLIIKPPEVIKVLPTNDDIFAKCNFGTLEYATSLSYNLLLIVLCTLYSFRIRKTTSMFNEVKNIGLVMYSTCIIWVALLPVHLGTSENYEPITMGLNATLNATAILLCLFGPKVYMIVFRPFRNVERSASVIVTNSVTGQQSKVIDQSKHFKQKPVATQETSVKLSGKQILKDKKREQVNSESKIVKNIVNENIDTDEKTSESKK